MSQGTYRINIVEAKLGVSRSTVYRLVKEGSLELIKISKRASGVTVESFNAYLKKQQEAAA